MNVSPQTVEALQQDGFEIKRASDLLPVSAPDWDILRFARAENMVIITHDLDFSALLALRGYQSPSLVTLRLTDTNPDIVTRRLRQALPQSESYLQEGSAVTVGDHTIRIRKLPIR